MMTGHFQDPRRAPARSIRNALPLCLLLSVLCASTALADGGLLDFQNPEFMFGSSTVHITATGPGKSQNVSTAAGIFSAKYYRGRTTATGTPNSYLTACNDVFQYLQDPTQYTQETAITSTTNTNKGKIAWLVDSFLNRTVAFGGTGVGGYFDTHTTGAGGLIGERSAGYQLAIWTLWYGGLSGYSFTGTANANVTNASAWFINQAASHSSYISGDATWLHDENQDQLRTDAIPEPAFYQMSTLLGLGFVAFRRRARR